MQRRRRNNAPSVFPPRTFPYGPQARSLSLPLPLQTKLLFLCGLVTIGRPRQTKAPQRGPRLLGGNPFNALPTRDNGPPPIVEFGQKLIQKVLMPYALGAEGSNIIASTIFARSAKLPS